MHASLRLYALLARWRRPSYRGKLVLAAGLGACAPLVGLLGYLAVAGPMARMHAAGSLAAVVLATALGVAATTWLVRGLLAPIELTARALRVYLTKYTKPKLPTTFRDEVGALMADAQHAIDRLDEVVAHVATYDRLTGLPNRAFFRDRVRQAVAQARRDGRLTAVLVLDVDGFQNVNLTFGHQGGDSLLTAVAQRLQGVVRESDLLARMDGDEFAILCTAPSSIDGVDALARRILESMALPFRVARREMVVGASIGITIFPNDDGSVEQLLGNAAAAMRAVQDAGGHGYQFFSAELNARLQHRLSVGADLRHALERGELLLHYQPKVDIASGAVLGFEALLRWNHPQRGLVGPVEFISIAEETGLIVPIGEWVLRTACAQLRAWNDAGFAPVTVAVNLSARQFRHADLVAIVRSALADSGIDPAHLELEVTESLLMEDTSHTVAVLQALRGEGVTISLDDFGTGYSSLGYLKHFPIDCIKLDKSFIRDALIDAQSGAITSAIIALGHSLGLSVVAEGVEMPEQLAYLAERSCDIAQGYLFGRPIPPEQVPACINAARLVTAA